MQKVAANWVNSRCDVTYIINMGEFKCFYLGFTTPSPNQKALELAEGRPKSRSNRNSGFSILHNRQEEK